jgi:nitrogen regulatory protein P-II 1
MNYRKITAVIDAQRLEKVESALQSLGVPGITVNRVKGYGSYRNFFTEEWTVSHVRVEIFLPAEKADEAVDAVIGAAYTGDAGDGIVTVAPVEAFYEIGDGPRRR